MKNNIELRVKAIEVKEDNYKVDLGKKGRDWHCKY